MSKGTALLAALVTMAMGPATAAAESRPVVDQAVAAFQSLCGEVPLTPAAVLGRADREGWRSSGAGATKAFDHTSERLAPSGIGPLVLKVTSETSMGERRDACAIAIEVPTTGLAQVVRKWLGFEPSMALGRSATYFAVRKGEAWLPGGLEGAEFARAKAEGRFYSIMVLDRGAEEPDQGPPATILLLRVMPSPHA